MAEDHGFEHLPLLFREHGPARFTGGGEADPATVAARANRSGHATSLRTKAQGFGQAWKVEQSAREQDDKPSLPAGVPLLLKIDADLDIDELEHSNY